MKPATKPTQKSASGLVRKPSALYEQICMGIFIGLILLGVIVFIFSIVKARSENEIYGLNMQYYNYAQEAFNAEQYDAALELVDQLIPNYKNSSSVQFLLGMIYSQKGNYSEAQVALNQAREKNALLIENQQFVYAYGEVMLNLQEYAAAQQYFLKSIQLDQNDVYTQASQDGLQTISVLMGDQKNE